MRDIEINSTVESLNIYHLNPNKIYMVQMSAINRLGEGNKSECVPSVGTFSRVNLFVYFNLF